MSKPKTIILQHECECGEMATSATYDTTQPDSGDVLIDVEFSVFDQALDCDSCGKRYFITGQIDEVE